MLLIRARRLRKVGGKLASWNKASARLLIDWLVMIKDKAADEV